MLDHDRLSYWYQSHELKVTQAFPQQKRGPGAQSRAFLLPGVAASLSMYRAGLQTQMLMRTSRDTMYQSTLRRSRQHDMRSQRRLLNCTSCSAIINVAFCSNKNGAAGETTPVLPLREVSPFF